MGENIETLTTTSENSWEDYKPVVESRPVAIKAETEALLEQFKSEKDLDKADELGMELTGKFLSFLNHFGDEGMKYNKVKMMEKDYQELIKISAPVFESTLQQSEVCLRQKFPLPENRDMLYGRFYATVIRFETFKIQHNPNLTAGQKMRNIIALEMEEEIRYSLRQIEMYMDLMKKQMEKSSEWSYHLNSIGFNLSDLFEQYDKQLQFLQKDPASNPKEVEALKTEAGLFFRN